MSQPSDQRVVCQVAVAAPLHQFFDYQCPPDTAVGARVSVQFGRRREVGVVVAHGQGSDLPVGKIKPVLRVIDAEPVIDSAMLRLLQWAADYYRHPVGDVILSALPKRLRDGEPAHEEREGMRLTAAGSALDTDAFKRAPRQRDLHALLLRHAAGIQSTALRERNPKHMDAARRMQKSGWVERFIESDTSVPDLSALTIARGPTLNPDQETAVEAIAAAAEFRTFLLFGVTGSGKTEVYLRNIERIVRAGRQALVLVPEIALTPQLVERFERRFEAPIAALHSGMNDSERAAGWRAAREGRAAIVIGTRSAVYTPLANLGLIIIDEEHDASYKQQEGFRYSARDVAIYRARSLDVPIVLGSATPTLETLHNVTAGRYQRLDLPQRAGPGEPPAVHLIDLRAEPIHQGLSTALLIAMDRHIRNGGQVMLFLNRRGYAPAWFCSGCGELARCKHCDANMTYHHRENALRCHHCGARRAAPTHCESCNDEHKPVGQGTERIEDTLINQFPSARVARLDRDTTRKRGELDSLLTRMRKRQIDILVGTQMLTKGHHFPEVSMVGMISADQGLFSTDFRATERLAQTVVQMCGRAGRGERAGEVYIQTAFPEHPLLQRLIHDGYEPFAQDALDERQQAAWPPFAHLALVRARATDAAAPHQFLQELAPTLRKQGGLNVLGPASAPMLRRANQYRAQLLLQSRSRKSLNAALLAVGPQLAAQARLHKVRFSVDVDPIDLY
ncbi:MAG: primosomal protein N' [Gammaproteobacteria bacterium]